MKTFGLMMMCAGLFLVAFAIAGQSDLNATKAEFEHYCEMVNEGYWPDYDNKAESCE